MVEKITKDELLDKHEHWFIHSWRPAMAWQYTFICLFDFFIAPILLAYYTYHTGTPYIHWEPLTLKGGGLYHLSMGAIVGVTAWTRSSEKLKKMEYFGNDHGGGGGRYRGPNSDTESDEAPPHMRGS